MNALGLVLRAGGHAKPAPAGWQGRSRSAALVSGFVALGLTGCAPTAGAQPAAPAATETETATETAPPPAADATTVAGKDKSVDDPAGGRASPRFAPTKAQVSWVINPVDHTARYHLAPLPDGGVVVGGENEYGVELKGDLFLTRLDAAGQTVWQQLGTGRFVRDVVVGPNALFLSTEFSGAVSIAGGSVRATRGSTDLFVGRFGLDGKLLGGRVYATPEFDRVAKLAAIPDGSGALIMAHGAFLSASPSGPPDQRSPDAQRIVYTPRGGEDSLVSRLGPTGKTEWIQNIGTTGYDEPEAVLVAPDGDILIAGSRWQSQSGESEALDRNPCEGYVTRLAPDGTPRWSTGLSALSDHTRATSVQLRPDGRIVVRGTIDRPAPIGTVANDPRRGRAFRAILGDQGAVEELKAQPGVTCAAPHPSGGGTIVAHFDKDKMASDQNGLYLETNDGTRSLLLPVEGETFLDRCVFSPTGTLFVAGTTRPAGKLGALVVPAPRTVRAQSPLHTYVVSFVGAVTF
jgi:hypothetical protein